MELGDDKFFDQLDVGSESRAAQLNEHNMRAGQSNILDGELSERAAAHFSLRDKLRQHGHSETRLGCFGSTLEVADLQHCRRFRQAALSAELIAHFRIAFASYADKKARFLQLSR